MIQTIWSIEVIDPATGDPVGEPIWFTDAQQCKSHMQMALNMPVDGGVMLRLAEYKLGRVAVRAGQTA